MAEEDGLDVGADEGKGGSKKKLIIIVALLLVLLGGGGVAAYFFLFSGSSSAEGDAVSAESAEVASGPSLYLGLNSPFVVDFMVNGKQRYLQLKVSVKSKNAGQVDAVKIHMPLIRNSLVLLFSSQSFDELQTQEGKVALKAACLASINGILEQETGQGGIDGVLFTNFVMQ